MIEFAKKPLTKVIALTVCFLMLWQSAVWANPDFFQRNDLQAQTMSTNPNRIDSFLMMATGYLGRYLAKIESDPSKRNVHDLREGIKEELERLADNGELDEEYREIVEKIIKDLKQPFEHGEFIIDFGKYKIRYYNPGSNRIDYPGKTALAERDPINSYDVLGKDKEGEKIGNYVYRQILVKKALPPPSGDVPAEKKDAPPAGQIARGNPLDLYEALVSRDEPTRTFRYSDTHFRITAAKTLRQLIEKIDLPAGEKSIIKTAISEFLRSDLVEIDSIVLVDPFSNIGVNGWLLGFNTNEPEGGDKNTGTASKLNGFLRDKYKKTIAFSAQLLDLIRDDGPLLYEYLFHEIACPYLGHERARAIQEKLFSQNYDDLTSATGESGHIDGDLTLVIRRIISEHTEAMLAKEAEELKKTDFRGRGPVAAGEYYGRYNRWKERVKSLVSPAWLEFRKERRKRIIEFFLQRVERRFKYVQMKTKWIWDLEGLWTKVRLALNEKLVEEARSFAKELKAAHDEFMKTNPGAELLFAGDPSIGKALEEVGKILGEEKRTKKAISPRKAAKKIQKIRRPKEEDEKIELAPIAVEAPKEPEIRPAQIEPERPVAYEKTSRALRFLKFLKRLVIMTAIAIGIAWLLRLILPAGPATDIIAFAVPLAFLLYMLIKDFSLKKLIFTVCFIAVFSLLFPKVKFLGLSFVLLCLGNSAVRRLFRKKQELPGSPGKAPGKARPISRAAHQKGKPIKEGQPERAPAKEPGRGSVISPQSPTKTLGEPIKDEKRSKLQEARDRIIKQLSPDLLSLMLDIIHAVYYEADEAKEKAETGGGVQGEGETKPKKKRQIETEPLDMLDARSVITSAVFYLDPNVVTALDPSLVKKLRPFVYKELKLLEQKVFEQGFEPEYKAPLKRLKSWEDEYDEESFNRLKKWEKEKVYDDLAMALAKISGRVMEGDSLKVSGEAEAGTGRAVRELVAERYRITGRPLDWTMIYTKRHAYREETERPEVNYDPNAHNDFYKLGVIEFGAENDFAAEEAFEKAMEIALGKLEEKRRELTKMQADNKVSRETVAKTEREVKKWEELITRYSLTLGVMKHFTGQWDKEKIREAIPHYAKYLEDKQRKRDFAEEEKLSKAEKMKFELAMRLKKGAEPKKNAPKGLTMKEIRWMNVDGEGHAPAAFRFLYKLIAPHKPFEEYAVNTDPKIEEGIFTLLPFAVLSVLLWHGTVGFTGFLTGMGISYGTFVLAHLPNIVRAPPEDASIIDRVRMVLSEPLTFKNLARAFKAPLIVAVQNLYLTAVYGYLITLLSPMNAYMIFPVILAVFAYISAVEGHKETNLQAVREKKFAPAAIGGIPGKEDRSGKRKLSRIMEKDGYKTTYAVIKDLNVRNALVMVSIFILLATLGQWVHFFMTAGPRITNLLMIGSPLAIIWFILGLRAFKKAPVGTAAAGPGPAQAPGTMTKTKPSVVLDLKPWAAYLLLGLSSISFASLAVPMALFSWYPGLVGVNVGLLLAFSTYTLLHETGHGLPLHFLASEKAKHMRYSLTRKGLFFQVFMNIGEHARSIPSWKYRFLCFTGPLMGFLSFTLVNIYFIFNPANYTGAALPIHAFMLHMPLLIFLIFTGVGVMNLLPFFKGSDGKKIWRLGVETSAGEGLPVEIAEEIQKHLQARKILVDSRIEKGNKNSAGIDGNGKLRITIRGKKQVNVDEAKKAIDKLFGVSPAERGKTSAPGSLWSLDEDYAVHKAPWIEEGLFTAAPFAVFATLNMIGKMGFWGFWLGMAIVYGIFTGAHIVNYFRAPPKMKEENLFARIRWTFKAPVTVASFNLLITAIAALIISSISSLDASIIGTLFMAGIFTWPVFYINRSFHKFINFMAKGQTDHAPAAIKRKRFEDNEITQEAIESYTQEHVAAFSPTYRNIIEAIAEDIREGFGGYVKEKMLFAVVAVLVLGKNEETLQDASRIIQSKNSLSEQGYRITPEMVMLFRHLREDRNKFDEIRWAIPGLDSAVIRDPAFWEKMSDLARMVDDELVARLAGEKPRLFEVSLKGAVLAVQEDEFSIARNILCQLYSRGEVRDRDFVAETIGKIAEMIRKPDNEALKNEIITMINTGGQKPPADASRRRRRGRTIRFDEKGPSGAPASGDENVSYGDICAKEEDSPEFEALDRQIERKFDDMRKAMGSSDKLLSEMQSDMALMGTGQAQAEEIVPVREEIKKFLRERIRGDIPKIYFMPHGNRTIRTKPGKGEEKEFALPLWEVNDKFAAAHYSKKNNSIYLNLNFVRFIRECLPDESVRQLEAICALALHEALHILGETHEFSLEESGKISKELRAIYYRALFLQKISREFDLSEGKKMTGVPWTWDQVCKVPDALSRLSFPPEGEERVEINAAVMKADMNEESSKVIAPVMLEMTGRSASGQAVYRKFVDYWDILIRSVGYELWEIRKTKPYVRSPNKEKETPEPDLSDEPSKADLEEPPAEVDSERAPSDADTSEPAEVDTSETLETDSGATESKSAEAVSVTTEGGSATVDHDKKEEAAAAREGKTAAVEGGKGASHTSVSSKQHHQKKRAAKRKKVRKKRKKNRRISWLKGRIFEELVWQLYDILYEGRVKFEEHFEVSGFLQEHRYPDFYVEGKDGMIADAKWGRATGDIVNTILKYTRLRMMCDKVKSITAPLEIVVCDSTEQGKVWNAINTARKEWQMVNGDATHLNYNIVTFDNLINRIEQAWKNGLGARRPDGLYVKRKAKEALDKTKANLEEIEAEMAKPDEERDEELIDLYVEALKDRHKEFKKEREKKQEERGEKQTKEEERKYGTRLRDSDKWQKEILEYIIGLDKDPDERGRKIKTELEKLRDYHRVYWESYYHDRIRAFVSFLYSKADELRDIISPEDISLVKGILIGIRYKYSNNRKVVGWENEWSSIARLYQLRRQRSRKLNIEIASHPDDPKDYAVQEETLSTALEKELFGIEEFPEPQPEETPGDGRKLVNVRKRDIQVDYEEKIRRVEGAAERRIREEEEADQAEEPAPVPEKPSPETTGTETFIERGPQEKAPTSGSGEESFPVMQPAPVLFEGKEIGDDKYQANELEKRGKIKPFDRVKQKYHEPNPEHIRLIDDEKIGKVSKALSEAGLGMVLEKNLAFMRYWLFASDQPEYLFSPFVDIESLEAGSGSFRMLSKIVLPDVRGDFFEKNTKSLVAREPGDIIHEFRIPDVLTAENEQETVYRYIEHSFILMIGYIICVAMHEKAQRGDLLAMELIARSRYLFDERCREGKKIGELRTGGGHHDITIWGDDKTFYTYFAKLFPFYIMEQLAVDQRELNGQEIDYFSDVVEFLQSEYEEHGDAFFLVQKNRMPEEKLSAAAQKALVTVFNSSTEPELRDILLQVDSFKDVRRKSAITAKQIVRARKNSGFTDAEEIYRQVPEIGRKDIMSILEAALAGGHLRKYGQYLKIEEDEPEAEGAPEEDEHYKLGLATEVFGGSLLKPRAPEEILADARAHKFPDLDKLESDHREGKPLGEHFADPHQVADGYTRYMDDGEVEKLSSLFNQSGLGFLFEKCVAYSRVNFKNTGPINLTQVLLGNDPLRIEVLFRDFVDDGYFLDFADRINSNGPQKWIEILESRDAAAFKEVFSNKELREAIIARAKESVPLYDKRITRQTYRDWVRYHTLREMGERIWKILLIKSQHGGDGDARRIVQKLIELFHEKTIIRKGIGWSFVRNAKILTDAVKSRAAVAQRFNTAPMNIKEAEAIFLKYHFADLFALNMDRDSVLSVFGEKLSEEEKAFFGELKRFFRNEYARHDKDAFYADGSTKALKIEDEIDSWVQLPDRVTFSPSKDPLVNFFNTANRRKFSRLFSSLKRGRGAFRHLQNTIIQERRTAGTFKDEDDIKKRLDVSARMLRGLRHILSERFGEQYEFTDLLRPREDREREAEEPAVPPGQEEKQESAVMKPAPVLFAGEDIADENYEKGHVRKYGGPVSYDSGARRWADSDPGYARMIEDEGIEEFSRELSRAGLGCLLENNIGYMRIKVENTLSGKTIDPASQIAGLSADPARCRLLSKILLPDIKDDILNEEYERYAEELLQTLGVKLDRDTLQERISYLKEMFKQKLGCQAGGAIASALFRKGTRGDLLASELVGRAVDVFEKQQARLGNEEKIRKIKKESPLEYAEGYVHALFQYFALYLRPGSGIGPEKLNEEERAFFGDVVAFLRGERKRYGDAFFLSREDALTREEQEVIAEKVVLDIFNNAAKGELNSILQEANTVKDIPRTVNLIIRNRKYKSLGDFKNFDRGHVPRIFKAALKLGYCSRRGLQYVYLPEGLPEVRPAPAAAEPPAGGVALKPLPLLFTEPFWDQPPDHGEKIHFDKVAGKFDEAEPGYVRAITDEDLEEISGLVNRAGLQDLLRVNFAYSRVKFDEWKDDDPHTRRTLKIESPVEAHSHKVEILLPDLSEKLYDVMQGTFNIAQGASQEELEKIRSHRKISPVKEADYRVKNFLRDQVIEDISGAIWDALYLKMLRGDMRAMAPCLVCTDLAARRYKEPGSGLTQLGTIENDTEASREFFKKMFAAHIDSRNHPEVSPRTGDEIRFIHNVVKFLRSEFKRHGDALFIGSGQAMDSKELMPMMRKEILRFFNNASIDEIEKVLIGMGHKKESRELKKALKKVKTRKASSGYEDFNAIFEDTGFNEDYSTGFIRVLFFEGYFNAERPDEEPPVPVDTEAKSPTEIGGNGEPSDGDPTATTKWLKGLTPEMSAAKRAVFAAPFYEEPIYRFGVPLLVSSLLGVILGTVFTFDLATLPFYIAQAVSAIIFILHHEKGERAPPVIVSLLNGFILPLFSPGMFAFILQSMAIHSIVNLLFMKARSAPEEAEEERGDREEKLKEKARTGPKSLTLDEAVEMSLCYPFNLKIREKAYERLLDFDAQEAISKIVESGLNEDRASRLFACHRAIQHLLKKMPRDEKKKPAGLDLIETKLLDFMDHCLSCPLSKASESKFARFYVWDTLKELMILRDHELKNERRILNIMFVLLASSEKDMMSFYGGSGGSGEPAWAKAQAKFTVFLTFLINLTEGTKFKSLPSEAEKAVTSMLENPAFVEDYEIKLKLLMVLENILRLQNKEQIRKERGVIRGKLRGMPYKTREELSMRQLDNAARVIVELKEYWHEQAGKKDFGDAVEEMAILASGDRRLTAEQKVRFRIGLRNLKTKYLMIKHYARELGQGSPENCDPCELLKTVTGIEVAPDVEFNIRYDEKTPYTVYFEFEKGADYLDFAKKYTNDDSSAGSSEGFYSVEYGICFGFKEDGDSTYRHEVQHAFYDAAGTPPAERFENTGRRLNKFLEEFSGLLDKEKYEEAEAIIHTIAKKLEKGLRDEFIAFMTDAERLSDHFEHYMKRFGRYRSQDGVIVELRKRVKSIEDKEIRERFEDCLEKSFGSEESPSVRGYVRETIIENEDMAKILADLAGKERTLALLHLLPLNKFYRLRILVEYYRERYRKNTDEDLDRAEGSIDEYLTAKEEDPYSDTTARLKVKARNCVNDIIWRINPEAVADFTSLWMLNVALRGGILSESDKGTIEAKFQKLFSENVLKNERFTALLVKALVEVAELDRNMVERAVKGVKASFRDSRPKLEEIAATTREKYASLYRMFEGYCKSPKKADAPLVKGSAEFYDFAEIISFAAAYSGIIFDDTGVPGAKHPFEVRLGYLNKYLSEVEKIPYLAREFIDEKNLDSKALFEKIQEFEKHRNILRKRWVAYLNYYSRIADINFSPRLYHLGGDAAMLVGRHFEETGLPELFRRAGAPYYGILKGMEDRLKEELAGRIENDPELAGRLFRGISEQATEICDESVDWLIGIDPDELGKGLARRDLEKEYEGEMLKYEGTHYYMIRDLMNALDMKENDVFYDLGSGYGRVAFYAGENTGAGRVVGVEMVKERAEESRRVKERLGLERVEIAHANVRERDLSDGTVFFLFNPFEEETMKVVGRKLKKVAEKKAIRVVSWGGGISDDYFNAQKWLKPVKRIGAITIYESQVRASFDELQSIDLSEEDKRHRALENAKKTWLERSNIEMEHGSFIIIITPGGKRYRLVSGIHGGGFAMMYKAVEEESGQKVAVKIIRKKGGNGEIQIASLLREYTVLRDLSEIEGLVNAHDAGYYVRSTKAGETENYFVVMDMITGREPLDRIIDDRTRDVRETAFLLNKNEAVTLARSVLEALAGMHEKGFVHGDIKPEHIFVEARNRDYNFANSLLIDLGTALRLKKDGTAWVKELTGTPIYMAPETFSNIYSAKTDLYALGCVLFKLLTAHYPFKGRNMAIIGAKMKKDPPYAKDINSAVPAPLADFVYKLMERNPENRYKSAREAIKALEEIEIGFKKPEPGGRPAEADDLASRTKVWSIQSHGPEGQEAALKPAADVSAYVNKGEVNVPMAKIGVGRLKDGERMSTVGLQDCAGFIARGKKKDGSFVHVLGHLTPGNITGQIRAVASLLEKESLEAVEIYFNGSEYMRDSLIACLRGIRRILSAKLIVDFRKNIWREDIIQGRLSVPGSVGLDTRGFVSKETDIDGNEKDTARRWHLDKETLLEFEEESILELSAGVGLIPEINEKAWNHYRMTVIPAFSDEVVETSGGDKVLKCAVEAQEAAEKFVREKCPEADIPAWQIGDYVYEMCYNVKKHGGGGIVTLRRLYSGVKFTGFEVVARDLGAGIGEISEKLRQAVSVEKTDPRHGHGLRSLNESIFAGEGEITCETAGRVDKYNPDKKDFEKKKGAKTTVNKGTRISAKRKLYRAPYADEWGDLTPQFKEDAVRAIDTKLEDEKLIGKLVDAMIEFARSTAKKDPDAKALLAIDSDLGDENINRLYSELAKVLVELPDRNEELALFLENLEIITGKGKKLADRVRSISTESEKGNIKPENIVVVTTSGMANLYNDFNEEPTIAEIDNTDFPDEAYLPLLEIMLFTIARHLQWDQSELERYYKMIPNVTLMEDLERYDQEVLFVSKKAKRFIIRLIPDAVPFSGEIEVLRQNMLAALKRA